MVHGQPIGQNPQDSHEAQACQPQGACRNPGRWRETSVVPRNMREPETPPNTDRSREHHQCDGSDCKRQVGYDPNLSIHCILAYTASANPSATAARTERFGAD